MILLWGLEDDTPLGLVRALLTERRIDHVFLDQCDVLESQLEIRYAQEIRGELRVGNSSFPLNEFRGLYVRPYDFRKLPHLCRLDERSAEWRHAIRFEDMMWGFAELASAIVVNRPSCMLSNGSKPYQCRLIERQGFKTPKTLITTIPRQAREFQRQHDAVIYKSISGSRSIVSTLSDAHDDRLSDIRWCPTQFQEHIPGDEFRVHVVGNDVFACRVVSSAIDYRYGGARYEAAGLPRSVARRCVALGEALGLELSGIDLRRTPAGEWYCFEVNPSPAFSCYEVHTDQSISGAIVDRLESAPARP